MCLCLYRCSCDTFAFDGLCLILLINTIAYIKYANIPNLKCSKIKMKGTIYQHRSKTLCFISFFINLQMLKFGERVQCGLP